MQNNGQICPQAPSSKTQGNKDRPLYPPPLPIQIFLSPPVVLSSFISCFALVRQQIDSNTTGWQKFFGRVPPTKRNVKCSWPIIHLNQIQFCDPVVFESICYCTTPYQMINKSNTTGRLRNIWMGTQVKQHQQLDMWVGILICSQQDEQKRNSFPRFRLKMPPSLNKSISLKRNRNCISPQNIGHVSHVSITAWCARITIS